MLRNTSRQVRKRPPPRRLLQAAASFLNSCHGRLVLMPVLERAATVAQPQQPIADAAPDLWQDKLRPHLPTAVERTPARYPILCAVASSKEQLARKSADRYCPNKTAACS